MEIFIVWAVIGSFLLVPRWIKKRQYEKTLVEVQAFRKILTNDEIDEIITNVTDQYRDPEQRYAYIYTQADMPLGRASAFLSYHGTN